MLGVDGNKRRAKIHAAIAFDCIPLSIEVGPTDEHDSRMFWEVIRGIRLKRGRTRPRELVADSAYDTRVIRGYLRSRGIKSNIPRDERGRINPRVGRPVRFDVVSYRVRERSFEMWL